MVTWETTERRREEGKGGEKMIPGGKTDVRKRMELSGGDRGTRGAEQHWEQHED